eukprot:645606-Pyramimonas_sp.AAC.1
MRKESIERDGAHSEGLPEASGETLKGLCSGGPPPRLLRTSRLIGGFVATCWTDPLGCQGAGHLSRGRRYPALG